MTTEEKKDDCACGGLDAVYASIDALVDFARKRLELDPRDADWTRNRIFELFSLDSYRPTGATSDDTLPDDLLTRFRAAAVAAGLFDADEGSVYADIVMGMLSGTPSAVQDRFEAVEREHGGMEAMRWFYDYCVANNYVKKGVLDKNPRFDSHGLVITINLAKPEFKNMKKAAAGNSVAGGYPACTICHENEGFAGRNKRTLRTIPATLGDEPWFWQFSPYGYFYQHGICVNDEHTPMHVSRSTFGHLLDFVDRFPGYFLGCNAALPRIGGSVLAHDHYQGGGEVLPMHKAAAWATMTLPEYPDATIEILDWPGTAVRVVAKSRDTIIEVCDKIREGWINYSNPELDIICEGEDGKRSAVSPSAIITERGYGKRTPVADYPEQNRGGQGVYTIQMTERKGNLAAMKTVGPQHELFIVTEGATVIRVKTDEISQTGRATQGVIVMRFKEEGDQVISMALAEHEDTEDVSAEAEISTEISANEENSTTET